MRDVANALESQMLAEIERVKRSFRAELVPYGAYDAREIVPPGGRSRSRSGSSGRPADPTPVPGRYERER